MYYWIIFIAFDIALNYWLIEKKGIKPNYLISLFYRISAGILHGGAVMNVTPETWLPLLGFQVASFYLLFDLTLNLLRGKSWDYQGKDSGYFFDKLPKWAYYLLKLVCLIYLICYIL